MSKQRTEYRDHKTGRLIALVNEHVQGHHAGEIVYLPKEVGRVYVAEVVPTVIMRIRNNAEDCIAIHEIKVRADGLGVGIRQ